MSLFLRIFLTFWLAAILLATSFYLLGRFSGTEAIERRKAVLEGQAEIVASLLLTDGRRATMHWLSSLPVPERPHLINEQGKNPLRKGPQFNRGIALDPVKAGVHYLASGDVIIVASLPKISPPLFLFQQHQQSQLRRLPMEYQLLVAFVIISLVSYLLAATLTRRIRQLRAAAQVIAEGDLTARVTLKGSDEVTALAHDFNRMTERINAMLNSQRQLVSDVSHELRSPLARLRIALELAQKADDPGQSIKRIEKEADQLESLVTGLLSLARLESGQSRLEKQSLSLCELLKRVVEDANYEGQASQKKVRLHNCDQVVLMADPVMLRSAFENVIRNALRYTPAESEVTVNAQQLSDGVVITVDDEGDGVPPHMLDRLFEPFARVSEARDRLTGGYGLGLAITGKIMLAHGGEVKAENRDPGGLRVTLKLPHTPPQ